MLANESISTTKEILIIKSLTWLKDSHSLFDYDYTKNISKNQTPLALKPSYVFFYRNNSTSQVLYRQKEEMVVDRVPDAQLLGCCQIQRDGSKYRLYFRNSEEFEQNDLEIDKDFSQNSGDSEHRKKHEKVGLIVRSFTNTEHQQTGLMLKSGQRVKFGRVEYKVTVVHEGQEIEEQDKLFQNQNELEVREEEIFEQGTACRICLSTDQSQPTLFFCRPCNCKGSISVFHFQCLSQQCGYKVKKSNTDNLTQYNFQKFECEICKKQLPRYIKHKETRHDVLPFEKPTKTYLVLTAMNAIAPESKKVILYTYNEGSELRIGRHQASVLRLTDISVSRNHAKICAKNGEFYIYDERSKFGTLIQSSDVQIDLSTIMQGVQVGRSIFIFVRAQMDNNSNSKDGEK